MTRILEQEDGDAKDEATFISVGLIWIRLEILADDFVHCRSGNGNEENDRHVQCKSTRIRFFHSNDGSQLLRLRASFRGSPFRTRAHG